MKRMEATGLRYAELTGEERMLIDAHFRQYFEERDWIDPMKKQPERHYLIFLNVFSYPVAFVSFTLDSTLFVSNFCIKPEFRTRKTFERIKEIIRNYAGGKKIECCIFIEKDNIKMFVEKQGFVRGECPWKNKNDCMWHDKCIWEYYCLGEKK